MRIVYLMLTHLSLFALLKNKSQDWYQLIVLLKKTWSCVIIQIQSTSYKLLLKYNNHSTEYLAHSTYTAIAHIQHLNTSTV